jgi:hypothetical protein
MPAMNITLRPLTYLILLTVGSFSCASAPLSDGGVKQPSDMGRDERKALAPRRIVALADVHGDIDAARRALRLAGAIGTTDDWSGGELIVVQTGDQLDRGDDEQEILELFESLTAEAEAVGGAFHFLLGNHEVMNVDWDFRFVTPGGFADFEDALEYDGNDPGLAKLKPEQRARGAAFRPAGPFAMLLSKHDVILVLGETVFVHGGVLPSHVEYGIERINRETSAWMRGEGAKPAILNGEESPIWTRIYSQEPDDASLDVLSETLESLGAKRMVVGHTVQRDGICSHADGGIWCLDVGMAKHYGGPIQVIEILGDQVTILREEQQPAETP